jgi:hypothetical protein
VRRFNDLKNIDKVASVQAKVDAVTGVMQKNIESALKNTDRIEVRAHTRAVGLPAARERALGRFIPPT